MNNMELLAAVIVTVSLLMFGAVILQQISKSDKLKEDYSASLCTGLNIGDVKDFQTVTNQTSTFKCGTDLPNRYWVQVRII